MKFYWEGMFYRVTCYDAEEEIFMAYHSPLVTFFIKQNGNGFWDEVDPISHQVLQTFDQPEYQVIFSELEFQIKQQTINGNDTSFEDNHRLN